MAQRPIFRWHKTAQLFEGETPIARPRAATFSGFCTIPSHPTQTCLKHLATALAAGDGFCISADPLHADTSAPDGHFLTLTGGSTGQPKIIRRSMQSWIASFAVNARQFAFTSQDSLAVLGPLNHSLSLYGVAEGLYLGMDTRVLAELSPLDQANVLRRRSVTVLYATPTQLRLLNRAAGKRPLPDMRLVLCGGGALDTATARSLQHLFPNAALRQFYGAAETSFVTMTDTQTPQGAQGRPFPGVSLRILDETGHDTTEIGEVWVQSPYLFDAYASGEDAQAVWRDGYVSVGEMGRLDPHGNLFLVGRKSRRVTIADQSVFPDAIEAHLHALSDVQFCAILPIPDPLRGQRLVLVLEGVQDRGLAQRVRQSCRDTFGALATPQRVMFVDHMPLLPSGKVDLGQLANWLEQHL